MSTITIRCPDDTLGELLRRESRNRGESINKIVIETLENSLAGTGRHRRFRDLDHLAGTWSEAELEDFNNAVAALERIDPEDRHTLRRDLWHPAAKGYAHPPQ
jgi:hypothetical protein